MNSKSKRFILEKLNENFKFSRCEHSFIWLKEAGVALPVYCAEAQALRAHGFDFYYYNNKKTGELDFLIEYNNRVLPLEIKSGKNYSRHLAMDNVLSSEVFNIPKGTCSAMRCVRLRM